MGLLPVRGVTLADLPALIRNVDDKPGRLCRWCLPTEEMLPLHAGRGGDDRAATQELAAGDGAAGRQPSPRAFEDEALFQEYSDALKALRDEVNPDEEG